MLLKQRRANGAEPRNGQLLIGTSLPQQIVEDGITYALDLQLNQDAGFYLDTRDLRSWLESMPQTKKCSNTFAYTGQPGGRHGHRRRKPK